MLPDPIIEKLRFLYGDNAIDLAEKIQALLNRYGDMTLPDSGHLTEKDTFLITYADSLTRSDEPPLQTITRFTKKRLKEIVSTVHILPFFPYSSDDGFSVIDYRQVDPNHGDWNDINALSQYVDLCFDLVINHVSAKSDYFKGYLAGEPKYKDFFIALDKNTDVSKVVRPRTWPLLHRYDSNDGDKWCWTTFSDDQIDWNFANPLVFLEMLDILLFYIRHGARIIRLDAIAYLWKQLGTNCIHLPKTHAVVKLFRDLCNLAARHVLLMTETNVPHQENISYFGDGSDEAQIVYNFPLPPLVLHTLTAQNARHLTQWAATLKPVSDQTTFLNFTASHDGIGIRPAADLLDPDEFQALIQLTQRHGGNVSSKTDTQGLSIPYELNINYFDALNNPNDPSIPLETQIDRFILSQAIPLAIQGMPAIYIHSLLGSRNWTEGVEKTGRPRSINREKLDFDTVETELNDPNSFRSKVLTRYAQLIRIRRQHSAFHPQADQKILQLGDAFFAVVRNNNKNDQIILAIHNITGRNQQVYLSGDVIKKDLPCHFIDLISGDCFCNTFDGPLQIPLKLFQFMWLTPR